MRILLEDGRVVQLEFAAGDNGVTVRETFEAESANAAEQQRQGWQAILNNFGLFGTICGWLRACEGMGACGLVDNIPVTHRAHRPSWGSVDNVPVAHRSPALQEV